MDDDDPSLLTLTVFAQTRDEDGNTVNQYSRDITGMLTPERLAVLRPLVGNVVTRIMTDRSISAEDIEQGTMVTAQRREAQQAEAAGQQEQLVADLEARAAALHAEVAPAWEAAEEEARQRHAAEAVPVSTGTDAEPFSPLPDLEDDNGK